MPGWNLPEHSLGADGPKAARRNPPPARAEEGFGRVLGGSWQVYRGTGQPFPPSQVAERGWFLAPTPRLELPLSRLALVKQWDTTAKPASASLKSSGEKHRQGSSPGVKASSC